MNCQWFAHVCTIRGQGDVILWDSRLVHQGGAPASARASRAVAPCGQCHRGCYGRMVAYMCGLDSLGSCLEEFGFEVDS